MIRSLLSWPSKSKQAWVARQEDGLRAEFAPQLAALRQSLERQHRELLQRQEVFAQRQRELGEWDTRIADRRQELARVNEDLKQQIRLIEAKASPDSVWVEAFSRGFEKAWDTMWPFLAENVQKSRQAIEQIAIESTLARLDSVIAERAQHLGNHQAREIQDLLKKREEFLQKQTLAVSKEDKSRYEHYLTALDWMLHANSVHPHQPAT